MDRRMGNKAKPLPTLSLKPGEADRIVAGHPWVFAACVGHEPEGIENGSIVQVRDHRRRFLGVGLYNGTSKIRVRLLDRERQNIDQGFFAHRFKEARARRERWLGPVPCYRLVNAEADRLSGLIVDIYEDVAVLQITSLGLEQRKEAIVAALQEVIGPRAIFERGDASGRNLERLPSFGFQSVDGSGPVPPEATIGRLKMTLDPERGHKTGLYLDQQLNYQLVGELCAGKRVLDCFTFQGGFALHAKLAGAQSVTAVDQSADALACARQNAERNQLTDIEWVEANAFDWLKETSGRPDESRPEFDVIILDPPSFTRTRRNLEPALRGYKEIHVRALKLLAPDGLLVTFSCSHHVERETFEATALSAAVDTRRVLSRVQEYSQSPDHPIIPTIPETEYLKGFAYTVWPT